MSTIKLPTFECQRCGHKWHPKLELVPASCAWCKSPYWETASRLGESPQRARHAEDCTACKEAPPA